MDRWTKKKRIMKKNNEFQNFEKNLKTILRCGDYIHLGSQITQDLNIHPQVSPGGGSTVTNALTVLSSVVIVIESNAIKSIFIPKSAGSVTGSDPGRTFRGSSTYWIWVTMVIVLLPASGTRYRYCSPFSPFGNVNTRSTRSFSTMLRKTMS